MQLNQAEIIQLLRKRAGMNQGQFGAKAFDTTVQSGRTKIKNIELGKQIPSRDDLEKMARALALPVSALLTRETQADGEAPAWGTIEINASVLSRFPGLDAYLDLLNKAAKLNDAELIDHIATKICELLANRPSLSMAAPQ
jgi:transcriptional regulator with XRE-family HTH domain